MSKTYIPELPCEAIVSRVLGSQWRSLPEWERDGAWGVAIVKSILGPGNEEPGVKPDLVSLSNHLGVDREVLRKPYVRLIANGLLSDNLINEDRDALESNSLHAWCYYAGYASGHTRRWGT